LYLHRHLCTVLKQRDTATEGSNRDRRTNAVCTGVGSRICNIHRQLIKETHYRILLVFRFDFPILAMESLLSEFLRFGLSGWRFAGFSSRTLRLASDGTSRRCGFSLG